MAFLKSNNSIEKKGKAAVKAGAAFLFALFFAAAAWIYFNLGVLLNADLREMYEAGAVGEVIENTDGSVDISFSAEGGVYINKLWMDIVTNEDSPRSLMLIVHTADGNGGEDEPYIFFDQQPVYVSKEVINLNLSGITDIHIEDISREGTISSTFEMANIMIDNSLNKYIAAVIFAWLFAFSFMLMLLFAKSLVNKPERIFLIIGAAMGISMLIALPRTKVGYDEETHMQSVIKMAVFPEDELNMSKDTLYQLIITEYNNPDALPGTDEETRELDRVLDENCDYLEGDTTPDFQVDANRAPAYVLMAVGARIAMELGLGWSGVVIMLRLFNLIMYLAVMYAAVKITPVGKFLMAFVGLLPQTVFMAVTCSYDPFVLAFISLGYAFMLKGSGYLIPMLIAFVLGCLPKAVYAPVILMGILVMAIDSAAAKKGEGRIAKAKKLRIFLAVLLGILVFMVMIGFFIIPTVINPSESGDIRGGDVSELLQIGFILSSPLTYACILLRQMGRWFFKCWLGADCMTYMGHLVNGTVDFKGYYAGYIIMLLVIILLSHAGGLSRLLGRLKGKIPGNSPAAYMRAGVYKRIVMLGMVFFSSVLIWTAMYVTFTPPGAASIAGVQGRYFLPLMFPLYLALSGKTAAFDKAVKITPLGKLESLMPLCYYLISMAELLLLSATVWTAVISRFAL